MNTKRIVASIGAVVIAAAIVGGVYAVTTAIPRPAADTPQVATVVDTMTPSPTPTATPTPTPTTTVAPIVETPAPAATQEPVKEQAKPAAPPAPKKCPAGSTANSSDGTNDTSCLPTICFSIAVPDPAHPECDTPFKP